MPDIIPSVLPAQRHVLFLQGPTSPLWRELAVAFEAAGHKTYKIHVHMADALWWWRLGGINYRGRFSRWKPYLDAFVARHGITDILYYADRQPYHVVAQEVARAHGINAIAVENGYLRPDWLTVERGGMGVYSQFPDDPDVIRQIAAGVPEPDLAVRYPHGYWTEMVHEVAYGLFAWFYRGFYPFYRSGRYYNTIRELAAGIGHFRGADARKRQADTIVATLVDGSDPFYVVALQLQGDKQIGSNSPFRHIGEMIEQVISSFAAYAPANARLLFKQHPHDSGLEQWPEVIVAAANRHGVASRVQVIQGGDLGRLLGRARGCVLINSTVGLFSIRALCPTKALGIAIFDMPGLTHQGPLDDFWNAPEPVDPALANAFVRALSVTIQVKGSFYNVEGRRAAVAAIVARVAGDSVNGSGGSVVPPPRFDRARAIGVPVDDIG